MHPRTEQTARPSVASPFPTPAEIDVHIARARKMRAEAIAQTCTTLFSAARASVRRLSGTRPATVDAETALRSPLAAIRSSAETLRDNPDLTPAQRARFLDILIAEEQRLEEMIAGAFGGRAELRNQ